MARARINRESYLDRARELAATLAWLRLCAIAGQAATVLTVAYVLKIPIAVMPLLAGIGVLAAFALFAFWRLRQRWPLGIGEAVLHIAVDSIVLTYLLYFSGGATNPFVSLLVMPIALAAAALPRRDVVVVALLAAVCYLALIPWHEPLPSQNVSAYRDFNLHVAGMAISFVVSAGVLAFFISRLARALREREADVQFERERALRDEGILAIATQAAGTAHELNTPLSTIRTLLGELRREHDDDARLRDDLALLAGQAERCRDILRALVDVGRRQLAGTPQSLALPSFVGECTDHFHLLRPEIELATEIEHSATRRTLEASPDLRHALINLLSNAADASLAAGSNKVELRIKSGARRADFLIRDHGSGSAPMPDAGRRFDSSKRDGLGLGLALAHATAERLGGNLSAHRIGSGGLLQRLRVPLPAADNAAS